MKEQAHYLGKEAPATGAVQLEALGQLTGCHGPLLLVSLNLDMQLWATHGKSSPALRTDQMSSCP